MANVSQVLDPNPEDIDAIMITGNFIHRSFMLTASGVEGFEMKWAVIKEVMANTTKMIEKRFPGKPILPAMGYTDNLGGFYAPENVNLKTQTFDNIFPLWFGNLPDQAKMYSTFIEGGFYEYQVSKHLSVLSLNSLYFHAKNP